MINFWLFINVTDNILREMLVKKFIEEILSWDEVFNTLKIRKVAFFFFIKFINQCYIFGVIEK